MQYTISRWAKFQDGRTHRLVWHGLDVATVLEAGLDRKPALLDQVAARLAMDPNDARPMLLSLAALHDLGKVIASFQALVPAAMAAIGHTVRPTLPYNRRAGYGHDTAGWALISAFRDGQLDGEILDVLPSACLAPRSEAAFAALVSAFTGHHGHPSTDKDWLGFQAYANSTPDLAAAVDFARSMIAHYGWRQGFPTAEGARRASYLLNGLITLCDWLGSSSEHFQLISQDMPPAEYVETYSRKAANDVLDNLRPAVFATPRAVPARPFTDLFAYLAPHGRVTPSPLQVACERLFDAEQTGDGPVLVVIEDMTGAGKTEAADYITHRLIAAGRASGVYVGLPTMTTADQAFERRRTFFDDVWITPVDKVLAHSRAKQRLDFKSTAERGGVEAGEADCVDWFVRSSKRALLAPAGVGTVDQALLAGLRADYAGLRLLGLWGKVLVVDEVHAYDGYMLAVLEKLVEAQAAHGSSVVLMSATLPSRERTRLVGAFQRGLGRGNEDAARAATALDRLAFPALTVVHGATPPRLEPVAPVRGPGALERRFERVGSVEAAAAVAVDHAAAGRSVVWFRNTVDDALQAYERLLAEARQHQLPEPILWHARFLPGDRSEIERTVLLTASKDAAPKQRRSQIVVATQVGEQSLDLDFDALVSDLAPIDSLIQRVGRTRRHRRDAAGCLKSDGADERPNLPITVLAPDPHARRPDWYQGLLPGASYVYRDDARLWLGLTHLLDPETIPGRRRSGPIVLNDDLKPIIESVYADEEDVAACVPAVLRPALDAAAGRATEYRRAGQRNRLSFTQGLVADCTSEAVIVVDDDAFLHAPTRLGESYTVLLAFRTQDGVKLAGTGNQDLIASSEVRTRWRLAQSDSEAAQEALSRTLTPAQRKQLSRACLVVLSREGEGWGGMVKLNGRNAMVRYCRRRGLMVLRST
jgi:CRISPR-associated endonuclease/helicase Cas3